MLLELDIRNIALIESLHIDFMQGFNVLTGETGAGKSIIIDSINLVLGGRADKSLLRTGADRAMVTALFDISKNRKALEIAGEFGVDAEEGLISVSRELNASGRNVCRIAGTVLPLSNLKRLTDTLMDVHGQHEHQALLNPEMHRPFLDSFGDERHARLLKEISLLHAKRTKLAGELRALIKDASERERMKDMLVFQLREIEGAHLKAGEEAKLERKLKLLENAEKIRAAVETAYELTYSGRGTKSIQEAALEASETMDSVAAFDPRYAELSKELKGIYYAAQETGRALQTMRDESSFEPQLMEKITERLETVAGLEKKYGATEEEVIAYGIDIKARLETLENSDADISEGKKKIKEMDRELRALCEELTLSRKKLAKELESGVMRHLSDLGMGKTRFVVDFHSLEKPSAGGMDEIEFMLCPNIGEELRPLSSIVSGGELSRIMLAFKSTALDRDAIDSMVFDEIDTGVSGRMAQAVGEKMCMISAKKQVLCVTHLPQIASLASVQYKVEKREKNGRTHTELTRLDREGRVRELSRLIGGGEDTELGIRHAEELLCSGERIRERLT